MEGLGAPFVIDAAHIDETPNADETPEAYVLRLAVEKALPVSLRHPGAFVVGADTSVIVDEVIFGKPADAADARRMLRALSGRSHEVLGAFSILKDGQTLSAMRSVTAVYIRPLSDDEIESYVRTGEPMDKAGAYAIQGLAAAFVSSIEGSASNVIGLDIAALSGALRQAGALRDG